MQTVRDKINQIARRFYAQMGYKVSAGFDFEQSKHPQERLCFDLACIAWEEITGDTPDLESDFMDG